MPWVPEKPFNDIPLLPPAKELETKAVLKLCIEARAALAELKQAAELIPNQTVLSHLLTESLFWNIFLTHPLQMTVGFDAKTLSRTT